MDTLIKNQEFDTIIDSYTSEGCGVCHISGRAVFVPNTIKGETCRIKILKVTNTAVYGKALSIQDAASSRVSPICPVYDKCGGCQLQHMDYNEQLEFKLAHVNNTLRRIGKTDFTISQVNPSPSQTCYRNKAIYKVGDSGGKICFGFYRSGTHSFIPVDRCLLQSGLSDKVAAAVCDFMTEYHIQPFNEITGKGDIRYIYCRSSEFMNQVSLCIVANGGLGKNTSTFVSYMTERCPYLSGISLCVNKTTGNEVLSGKMFTLWGQESLTETLSEKSFKFSPKAFFQVNPRQTEKLYAKAIEYASSEANHLAVDLYCGTGSITMFLADRFQHVIGAEIVPEAIESANNNALINGITNIDFRCCDAAELAAQLAADHVQPNVLVVDPPRKGLSIDVIESIAKISPQKLVYVSCNPSTLARDIALLSERGFSPSAGECFDMFPHTYHVETVVELVNTQQN